MIESEAMGKEGQTLEKHPKSVLLEVGTNLEYNNKPLILSKEFSLRDNQIYIGMDISEDALKNVKDEAEKNKINPNSVLFVRADGRAIPLPSKSVDTIFLGNVLGGIFEYNVEAADALKEIHPGLASIMEKELTPMGVRKKLISEARRVVKDRGKVIIFENITPEQTDNWGEGYQKLEGVLYQSGFIVQKKVREQDQEYGQIIKEFGISDQRQPGEGSDQKFVIVAVPEIDSDNIN